jgi:hypothetical protein
MLRKAGGVVAVGEEAGDGFFSRLRRVFGGGRVRAATLALPENPGELGFALTSRAPVLFSVFPRRGEEADAPGEPTQGFGVHLAHALHRRLKNPDGPCVVGLVGAGGAGKSSLFNELVGAPMSSVDILPHTTRGPLGVASEGMDVRGWTCAGSWPPWPWRRARPRGSDAGTRSASWCAPSRRRTWAISPASCSWTSPT